MPSGSPAACTPTFAMYQWFVRVPDADVGVMLRRFTFLDHEEIEAARAGDEGSSGAS